MLDHVEQHDNVYATHVFENGFVGHPLQHVQSMATTMGGRVGR
jgi:hypothetical protein